MLRIDAHFLPQAGGCRSGVSAALPLVRCLRSRSFFVLLQPASCPTLPHAYPPGRASHRDVSAGRRHRPRWRACSARTRHPRRQTVVVENRPGQRQQSPRISREVARHRSPLYRHSSPMNPVLFLQLPFDPIGDLRRSSCWLVPSMIAVHPSWRRRICASCSARVKRGREVELQLPAATARRSIWAAEMAQRAREWTWCPFLTAAAAPSRRRLPRRQVCRSA